MSERRSPMDEFERLYDQLTRQFGEFPGGTDPTSTDLGWSEGSNDIDVDVADRGEEFVVTADVPGFAKEDIDVTISGELLSIEATSDRVEETDEGQYLRTERSHQSVRRSIRLPEPIDEEETHASYRNGVLTITLPKVEPPIEGHHIDVE